MEEAQSVAETTLGNATRGEQKVIRQIEVRRRWRQIPEARTGGSDHLSDGIGLVGADVVHDDDIARLEDRHQQLFDIGAEALPFDRPVEDAWGGQTIARRAPRKVRVRQWPCGAKPRKRFLSFPSHAQRHRQRTQAEPD